MNPAFWRAKRVLVTGHSGFKGSWLSLWLQSLGAEVTGLSLPPPTSPSLFEAARVGETMSSLTGDVRNPDEVRAAFERSRPEIVFHLAAQPLVRLSYRAPAETYATNVMGTVNVLEAMRHCPHVRAAVMVTTDKCYENREWVWGYREDEPMGGHDPYSSSKGCAELAVSAYRRSYWSRSEGPRVASARAGNVIGGGDWAEDRLVPDMVRAIAEKSRLEIRNPQATRPWQHVLEPLSGYLALAELLFTQGAAFAEGWNFGPRDEDAQPVKRVVETFAECWKEAAKSCPLEVDFGTTSALHEAHYLKLDISKAASRLGWRPRLSLQEGLRMTAAWYVAHAQGECDMRDFTLSQIKSLLSPA